MLKGKMIKLRALESDDSEKFRAMLNNLDSSIYPEFRLPINEARHAKWYEELSTKEDKLFFSVVKSGSDIFIGTIWIDDIDWINRKCRIYVIGDFNINKNELTDGVQLLTDYCFESLNINKIYSIFPQNDTPFKELFEKAGYSIEAMLQAEFFIKGEYTNGNMYSKIREKNEKVAPKNETVSYKWFQSQKTLKP